VLYICYQSVLEPLTQTQVIRYLEGLILAGHRICLLTFEPASFSRRQVIRVREQLSGKGITWDWVRYHNYPTVPATAWDIFRGILAATRLSWKYGVSLLHARAHVAGLIALAVKRVTGAKFLFDLRGFMAEERVDAGIWPPGGALFQATKYAERALVSAADGIIVLTPQARKLLAQWYPRETARKAIQIIPCCVDRRYQPAPALLCGQRADDEPLTLVYAGKLGGWYLTEEMVAFVAEAAAKVPNLRWQVWTQSDSTLLSQLVERAHLSARVQIGRLAPDVLAAELPKCRAGLALIRPSLSKLASSPTKIGEYLAAGLPVVASAGVGDVDELLTGNHGTGRGPVGVLVRRFTADAYREVLPELLQLVADPTTPARCRATAADYLDLQHVGWARYRQIYQALLGPGRKPVR